MPRNDHFSTDERRAVISISGLYGLRMLGLFMVLPVLALYADDYRYATPLLLGFALGVYGLTQALLQIPLGLVSDRLGRKPVIVAGLLLFVIGSLMAAQAETVYGLIAGRALQGAGAIAGTLMALVADVTREQNRTKAMASIGGSIGFAFFMAIILGPWVSSQLGGLPAVFWVTALLGTLGLLWAQWRLPAAPRFGGRSVNREGINREAQTVPAMISGVLKDIRLLRLNLGIFTLHLILMAAFMAIPKVLVDSLQLPLESHWWVYLLLFGGSFFAMIPAIIAAERGGHIKPVFLGAIALATFSLAGFALGYDSGISVALSLLFLFFMAFNLLEASLPSLVSKTAPAGARGTAMGVYTSSQFLGAFIGGVLGGWLLPVYGVTGLFAVLALAALLWLLLVFPMEAPRSLSGVVLKYCDGDDYVRKLEALPGVEEVVLVADEQAAYAKVDRKEVDWGLLRPYLSE